MTATKIINIGGYKIPIPAEPKDKSEILFYNDKPEDAYWRRQDDFPDIWHQYNKYVTELDQPRTAWNDKGKLVALSHADSKILKDLQARELKRRKHGIHFKNGSKVIWMPGDYYFTLQWCVMKGLAAKYGNFLWFQNDIAILIWHAQNHKIDIGGYISKAKKTGISQEIVCLIANQSTMLSDKEFGMRSKNYEAATLPVNMVMYFLVIDNMPDILLPEIERRNQHEILFGKSEQHKKLKSPHKPLNTRVFACKTVPSGFDAPLMFFCWDDEFPKFWESSKTSPDLCFKKTIETVKKQFTTKVGTYIISSYPPEKDDRGYVEARKIYFDCKKGMHDMFAYHIPSLESTEGTIDKYGRPDMVMAKYLQVADRAKAKGEKASLLAKMRQYPENEDEAWGVGGISTAFNAVRLGIQIKDIEEEFNSGGLPYSPGRLEWTNPLWEGGKWNKRPPGHFVKVKFTPLSDEQLMAGDTDKFHLYKRLPAAELNKALNGKVKKDLMGRIMPAENSINVGGVDTTDYRFAGDVEDGSVNASFTSNVYDVLLDTLHGPGSSNIILSEYYFDPENPDEFYEDLVKEIIYFDKRVIVEANKKWVLKKLKDDGLHNYLILWQKDGTLKPYEEDDENRLVSTVTDSVDTYVRLIRTYWAEPAPDGIDIDYLKLTKSDRLLRQASNFKPEEAKSRKKADLVMAFGLTRLAVESFSTFKKKEEENLDQDSLKAAFNWIKNN